MKNFTKSFKEAIVNLSEEIIKNDPQKHLYLPPEAAKDKIQLEIASQLERIPEKIDKGIMLLLDKMEQLSVDLPETVTKSTLENIFLLGNLPPPEEIKAQMLEGKSLKDIAGITNEALQAAYVAAIDIYNAELFVEATDVFFVLTLLDPSQYLLWLGLGNADYYSKLYDEALNAYAIAFYVNPEDPRCHLYAGHCYAEMGEFDFAINSLQIGLYVVEQNPDLEEYRQGLETRIEELQKLYQ